MQSPFGKLYRLFLALWIPAMLVACSAPRSSANPNLVWAVSLERYEIKQKLEIVETVNQYSSSYDEYHQQAPADGNVYLLLKLTVSKQGTTPTAFDWSQLVVRDSAGNSYQRLSNDSFLEQYKYTPRMTGLEIKLGENEGWLGYEIPKKAAEGKLTLAYGADGSQQEIPLK